MSNDDSTDTFGLRAARPEVDRGLERNLKLEALLSDVLGERPPPVIGRFTVDRRVAGGGMGVVFQARDETSGETVALKVMRSSATGSMDSDDAERFAREALALRAIQHPAIVRYVDHGEVDGYGSWLAMEWLDGVDLGERLGGPPLAIPDVLEVARRSADALAACHETGVVHRDVKPANLFLVGGAYTELRLIDFGIARGAGLTREHGRLTQTGAAVGSPHYMAPEQLRGVHSPATDVYGLGVTLFQCLTGQHPFSAENPAALLLAIVAEPVPDVRRLRPDISPDLALLVERMMAKDPSDRPAGMRAVLAALGTVSDATSGSRRLRAGVSRFERDVGRHVAVDLPTQPAAALPMLGRSKEMGWLTGILSDVLSEQESALVRIHGDHGLGKTRLLHSLLTAIPADTWNVRSARGSRALMGHPYALVSDLASPREGTASSEERDFLSAVSEVSGVSARPANVSSLADAAVLKWLDLLTAWTRDAPLAMIVDDAELADVTSLSLLGRALDHLDGHPLVVVLTTTASNDRALAMAHGLSDRQTSILPLRPLGFGSATRLARTVLGGAVSQSVVSNLVQQSGGVPGRVLELARDQRDGVSGSGSLAERVWNRVERLDPEARRYLRAAAIVGDHFGSAVVGEVLGGEAPERVAERLGRLVDAGHLSFDGLVYRFNDELLRLAAYERSGDEDLAAGHLAAASWLHRHVPHRHERLAHHFLAGGRPELAYEHLVEAAMQALAAQDRESLRALTQRASACAPVGADKTPLLQVQAEASFWDGDFKRALNAAREGMALAPVGTRRWFELMALSITAAGQSGDNGRVIDLAADLLESQTVDAMTEDLRVQGLARAQTQLAGAGITVPVGVSEALRGLDEGHLEAATRAWLARGRVFGADSSDHGAVTLGLSDAQRFHFAANDPRSAAVMSLFWVGATLATGGWEQARTQLDEAQRLIGRLRADYLEYWASYYDAKFIFWTGTFEEADEALSAFIDDPHASPRFRDGARAYLGFAAATHGHWQEALEVAETFERPGLSLFSAIRAAIRCRVEVGSGQPSAGMVDKLEIIEALLRSDAVMHEWQWELHRALAEGWEALGHRARLEAGLALTQERMRQYTRAIQDPTVRSQFLSRLEPVRDLLRRGVDPEEHAAPQRGSSV